MGVHSHMILEAAPTLAAKPRFRGEIEMREGLGVAGSFFWMFRVGLNRARL
jgi:hypothetical protein